MVPGNTVRGDHGLVLDTLVRNRQEVWHDIPLSIPSSTGYNAAASVSPFALNSLTSIYPSELYREAVVNC